MKKIILVALLFIATYTQAQITLEHVFDGNFTISTNGSFYLQFNPAYVQSPYFFNMYARYDENDEKGYVDLYDINTFSLYKSVDVTKYNGYEVCCVSKNIFTTDGKVSFVYGGNIINEDGQLIATVEYGDSYKDFIYPVNNRYILVVYGNDKTYVYSLPGNGTASAVNNVEARTFDAPYPNPSKGTIILPYEITSQTSQMKIYNINGQLMETHLINNQADHFELNTENYPNGMYFYEADGASQSFIVEK